MKRIVLLTLEYPPMVGGVAHYYARLVEALPKGSIEVVDNSASALLSNSRFFWPRWLKAVMTLRKMHAKEKIDCLLVGQILPLGTVAFLTLFFLRIPYIICTHAMDITVPFGREGKKRHRFLIRMILRYARVVTTVSHFTAQHLERIGVSQERIALLMPCPSLTPEQEVVTSEDLTALDEEYDIQGKQIIFSAGRLVIRKGFDTTLAAFEYMANKSPDTILVLAGSGPDADRLQKCVQKSPVRSRILFLSKLSQHDLATWYTRCAVYVMPSRDLPNGDVEGFGITYLEANAFGKPVIGGNSGGIADAIIHGKTGYIVDPKDVEALAQTMLNVVTNSTLARILGTYARERVQRDFQWHVRAKDLLYLIETHV